MRRDRADVVRELTKKSLLGFFPDFKLFGFSRYLSVGSQVRQGSRAKRSDSQQRSHRRSALATSWEASKLNMTLHRDFTIVLFRTKREP